MDVGKSVDVLTHTDIAIVCQSDSRSQLTEALIYTLRPNLPALGDEIWLLYIIWLFYIIWVKYSHLKKVSEYVVSLPHVHKWCFHTYQVFFPWSLENPTLEVVNFIFVCVLRVLCKSQCAIFVLEVVINYLGNCILQLKNPIFSAYKPKGLSSKSEFCRTQSQVINC